MHTTLSHISCLTSALWLHHITCKGSKYPICIIAQCNRNIPQKVLICYTKHPWCKKREAKSEAPVTSIFCIQLKGVISGRGQGLLRFNYFVDAAIYNHVQQAETMHVDKQLKLEQLKNHLQYMIVVNI